MSNGFKRPLFISMVISIFVGFGIIIYSISSADVENEAVHIEKFNTKDEFVKLENVQVLKEESSKNPDNTTSTVITFILKDRRIRTEYIAVFSNNNFMFILKNGKILDNNELFGKDEITTEGSS